MRIFATLLVFWLIVLTSCTSQEPPATEESIATNAPTATYTLAATLTPTDTPEPTSTPTLMPVATPTIQVPIDFDGDLAYDILLAQMEMGPRWPGSPGHTELGDFIKDALQVQDWQVEEQRFVYQGLEGRNIIGRANFGAGPVIILGAHYDHVGDDLFDRRIVFNF